jgi:hypothetical protein
MHCVNQSAYPCHPERSGCFATRAAAESKDPYFRQQIAGRDTSTSSASRQQEPSPLSMTNLRVP